MDREERKDCKEILEIPEAELMDFWEEGSEYIMYDRWDRIKDWVKKIFKK